MKKIFLSFFFLVTFVSSAHALIISTTTPFKIIGGGSEKDVEIYGPTDVKYDKEGNLLVFSYSKKPSLKKFSPSGSLLWKIDKVGSANGELGEYYEKRARFGAIGSQKIATDAVGNVYIYDQVNFRIQKFTKDGAFLLAINMRSSGESYYYDSPVSLAIDSQGNIYWAGDVQASGGGPFVKTVRKYAPSGELAVSWPVSPVTGPVQGFDYNSGAKVSGLVIDSEDNLYLSYSQPGPTYSFRPADRKVTVEKYSSQGTSLNKWGTYGTGDGEFTTIVNMAIDTSDNLYIIDANTGYLYDEPSALRIQKMTKDGVFISKFGAYGITENTLLNPTSITVNVSGEISIADTMGNKVVKYSQAGVFLSTLKKFDLVTPSLFFASNFAVDSNKSVYVTDASILGQNTSKNLIKKISPLGELEHLYVIGATTTPRDGRISINGLTVDDQNDLYVSYDINDASGGAIAGFIKKFSSSTKQEIFTASANTRNYGVFTLGDSSFYEYKSGAFVEKNAAGSTTVSMFINTNRSGFFLIEVVPIMKKDGRIFFGGSYLRFSDQALLNIIFSYPLVNGASYTRTTIDPMTGTPFYEEWTLDPNATTSPLSSKSQPLVLDRSFLAREKLGNIVKYSALGVPEYRIPSTYGQVTLSGTTVYLFDQVNGEAAPSSLLLYRESDILGLTTPPSLTPPTPEPTPAPSPVVASGGGGGGGGSSYSSPALTTSSKGESYAPGSTDSLALIINKGREEVKAKVIPVTVSSTREVQKTVYRLFDKKTGTFVGSSTVSFATSTVKSSLATTTISVCSLFERKKCQTGSYTLATEVQVTGDQPKVFLSDLSVTSSALSSGTTLTKTLQKGESNPDIKLLQEYLKENTKVFASSSITGYFGSLTEKAVQELQCAQKIVCSGSPKSTGWGVVGRRTREVLK